MRERQWQETRQRACVPGIMVDIVSGQVHGSEVRGTCWPLQVHNGMHPEGMPDEDGKGMAESPHVVRVLIPVDKHKRERVTLCVKLQCPQCVKIFTVISGLCCFRYRTAAPRQHPPELSAFHTWMKRGEKESRFYCQSRCHLGSFCVAYSETKRRHAFQSVFVCVFFTQHHLPFHTSLHFPKFCS